MILRNAILRNAVLRNAERFERTIHPFPPLSRRSRGRALGVRGSVFGRGPPPVVTTLGRTRIVIADTRGDADVVAHQRSGEPVRPSDSPWALGKGCSVRTHGWLHGYINAGLRRLVSRLTSRLSVGVRLVHAAHNKPQKQRLGNQALQQIGELTTDVGYPAGILGARGGALGCWGGRPQRAWLGAATQRYKAS